MKNSITSVGLDVHKDSIEIAAADHDGSQAVRRYGEIGGDLISLDKAIRKLQSLGKELRFCL